MGNRKPLQYMVMGKLDSYHKKNQVRFFIHIIYSNNMNSNDLKDLNVKTWPIKILKENTVFFFWILYPYTREIRENLNELHQTKSFLHWRKLLTKWKGIYYYKWEMIFQIYIWEGFNCQRRQWQPTTILFVQQIHEWRTGRQQSMGSLEVRQDWEDFIFISSLSSIGEENGSHSRCSCLEKAQGRWSLVGCHLWGHNSWTHD